MVIATRCILHHFQYNIVSIRKTVWICLVAISFSNTTLVVSVLFLYHHLYLLPSLSLNIFYAYFFFYFAEFRHCKQEYVACSYMYRYTTNDSSGAEIQRAHVVLLLRYTVLALIFWMFKSNLVLIFAVTDTPVHQQWSCSSRPGLQKLRLSWSLSAEIPEKLT